MLTARQAKRRAINRRNTLSVEPTRKMIRLIREAIENSSRLGYTSIYRAVLKHTDEEEFSKEFTRLGYVLKFDGNRVTISWA